MTLPIADELLAQASAELGRKISLPPVFDDHANLLYAAYEPVSRYPVADLSFRANIVRRLRGVGVQSDSRVNLGPAPVTAIAGLPRTGSTLLHNLLSLVPRTRYVSHAAAIAGPCVVGEGSDAELDARARLDLLDLLDPRVRDAHPMDVWWPDECTLLLEYCFQSYQFAAAYGLPEYLEWLMHSDWGESYDWYGRHLGAFLSPGTETDLILLKSPFHVLHLDELGRVLPTSRVVLTVRDAMDVAQSWLRLVDVTHQALFDEPLPAQLQTLWLEVLARMAEASVQAVSSGVATVVRYEDLAKDPVDTAMSLSSTSEGMSSDTAEAMRYWLAQPEAQRRSKEPIESLPLSALNPTVADRFVEYNRFFDYV